jgi:FAD/FMN-containing dehydrogenase
MATAVVDAAAIEGIRSFGGQLLIPESEGYDDARRVFNAMIDRRPALIARCTGVADVKAALAFANERELPVAIRGGGHAVSGHAVNEGGVVVDTTPMKGVRVDRERRTAIAQAGLTWGELDRETQAFGLAVTGGRVPDTGVAGLTLGGGSGWIERKHGYTIDNLVSVDLVTADGEVVTASEDREPELFWALRGGGGNFGVVTSFEFQLHPVGPILLGGMMMFPIERAAELMRAYREFIADAADEVGGACAILTAPPEEFVPEPVRGQKVFGIVACYVGPVEEGEEALRPLRELEPAMEMLGPIPYADGLQRLIEAGNPPGMQHYWKAGFLQELTDEAIETFVSHAREAPSPLTANLMLPLGGAIARVGEDEAVLGNRDALWNFHLLSQWPDPGAAAENIEWTRAFDREMSRHALEAIYVNFVADPPDDLLERSFGSEKYRRLVAVKERFDPRNVFRFNQNIPPSGGDGTTAGGDGAGP